MKAGRTINILLKEMESFFSADLNKHTNEKAIASIASEFSQALDSLKESVDWFVRTFPMDKRKAFAGSVSFLKLMGIVSGVVIGKKSALSPTKSYRKTRATKNFYLQKL